VFLAILIPSISGAQPVVGNMENGAMESSVERATPPCIKFEMSELYIL